MADEGCIPKHGVRNFLHYDDQGFDFDSARFPIRFIQKTSIYSCPTRSKITGKPALNNIAKNNKRDI
jgi:hypothetical protein